MGATPRDGHRVGSCRKVRSAKGGFGGRAISYANKWEGYSDYFEEGVGFLGTGPPPTFWPLMVILGPVLAPVGGPFPASVLQ